MFIFGVNRVMSDLIRGNQLLRSGNLKEAITAYQRAISYNPNSYWCHYKLGEALESFECWEEAIEAYKKAIELKPEASLPYLNLERCLQNQERVKETSNHTIQLPDFLGIGAQKSGTTWLHEMLKQHPQICLPSDQKELHFFDSESRYETLGIEGYKSFFKDCNRNHHKVVGEITPGYLWTSPFYSTKYQINPSRVDIPKRVYNMLGSNIKLIVLLRNPVARAVSGYFHHVKKQRISIDDDILEIGKKYGIIQMGFYSKHLCHWMKYYPLSSFKILIYENIVANKEKSLKDIFNFLNVNENVELSNINKAYNKGLFYRKTSKGISVFRGKQEVTAIKLDEIQKLYELYQEDMQELEKLFELDISQWKFACEQNL